MNFLFFFNLSFNQRDIQKTTAYISVVTGWLKTAYSVVKVGSRRAASPAQLTPEKLLIHHVEFQHLNDVMCFSVLLCYD